MFLYIKFTGQEQTTSISKGYHEYAVTEMFLTLLSRDAIDEGLPNPHGQIRADISIAMACLAFLFVSARLATRFLINKKIAVDDHLIVFSLVGFIYTDMLFS